MPAFEVSVIIPVYNAANYLNNAIESVIGLQEVGEIILVEDNSPDNAYELCLDLERKHRKVKVYRHPNGENRGAGASRNLGIQKSTCHYIAFLDADDWYLPSRFITSKAIFENDESVDGVYEATGYYYENTQTLDPEKLTTLKHPVEPEKLLYNLLRNDGGRFTTDAITFKRSMLAASGLFDSSLRLHQDTHLWLRFAFVGKMVAGQLNEAVAIRRVHDQNRIQHYNLDSRKLLYKKTFEWFRDKSGVDPKAYRIMFKRYAIAMSGGMPRRMLFTFFYFFKRPMHILKFL